MVARFFRCKVVSVGPQPGEGKNAVAVELRSIDPPQEIGWRYAERMHSEILATALTAISADLEVWCQLENQDGSGKILAFNLVH